MNNNIATSNTKLLRVLGTPALVMFGLVYMVPLTIFTTYGGAVEISGGRLALAYIVTTLVMILTARSYGLLARVYPGAGSAYTYVQKEFGAATGFVSGWVLMLDYLFLPMINYLVVGLYLHEAFGNIPSFVFILIAIALVTFLNIIGIKQVARTNTVIIALQAVFIIVFVALAIVQINGSGVDIMAPFTGDGSKNSEGLGPVIAAAAILCLSFLGFDSVSAMSEEAKNPTKTVPKAIIMITLMGGSLFIFIAVICQYLFPSNDFADADVAFVDVINSITFAGTGLADFMNSFFIAAYVAGATGSALVSQSSVSRILYAMGRDGVLFRSFLGKLSSKYATPVNAIVIVSIISLAAIWIDLNLLISLISFGALVAFTMVNLSAMKRYYFSAEVKNFKATILYLVLPLLGAATTVYLWFGLDNTSKIVGGIWAVLSVVVLAFATAGFTKPVPTLDMKE